MHPKILILGGTAEAAQLAGRVAKEFAGKIETITSLAGRMVTLPDIPGRLRVGGFGGSAGLAEYLAAEGIQAVIDATHPFARNISAHALEASAKTMVPLVLLERPPWPKEAGDNWTMAANMDEAARLLPTLGRSAFLTVGRQELAAFLSVQGVRMLVRLIDRQNLNLPGDWDIIEARPPFAEEDETKLLQEKGIDVLVTKASGGTATYGKIAAARRLGIPVLMVERPKLSGAVTVKDVGAALAWIRATLFSRF
jgi:precorrin-6A/cobalt-precorrin-6A reductase